MSQRWFQVAADGVQLLCGVMICSSLIWKISALKIVTNSTLRWDRYLLVFIFVRRSFTMGLVRSSCRRSAQWGGLISIYSFGWLTGRLSKGPFLSEWVRFGEHVMWLYKHSDGLIFAFFIENHLKMRLLQVIVAHIWYEGDMTSLNSLHACGSMVTRD